MNPLTREDVSRIARQVAEHVLPRGSLIDVTSEPGEDWIGDPAWRVKLLIRQADLDEIVGRSLGSKVISVLQEKLQDSGEDRFAYVSWQTDEERAHRVDTESHGLA